MSQLESRNSQGHVGDYKKKRYNNKHMFSWKTQERLELEEPRNNNNFYKNNHLQDIEK